MLIAITYVHDTHTHGAYIMYMCMLETIIIMSHKEAHKVSKANVLG